MKILKRILLAVFGLIALLVLYVQFGYNVRYDAPYPEIQLTTDSAALAHGEYLIYGPAHCANCHTHQDDQEDLKAGKLVSLKGGNAFELPFATIYTKNLTPDRETGIGALTDRELARTMRYSVDHEGHSLPPFMPFSEMSDADLSAIISYLRKQEPVKNFVPEAKYNLLGKAVKRFLMKPLAPESIAVQAVTPDSSIAYGRYLANGIANCKGCHTPFNMQKMQYEPPLLRGGTVMSEKTHVFTSPNLTPDPATGHITEWSEDTFVQRFRAGRVFEDSPMPWEAYSRMKERDLKAIYRYLQSLEPVENEIVAIVTRKETK